MLNKLKNRKSEGFTIIEVLIVLAIAGLILLIVFLAVPALQRNSRNTQRKNDASHLAGLVSEWESNNAGATFTNAALTAATSGQSFAIIAAPSSVVTYSSGLTASPDTVKVVTSATCNVNALVSASSTRAIAIIYGLEGSTTQGCVTAS